MGIVLPTIASAFAAFCVWLGVRVFNRRERWAKWTLVAAAVIVAVSGYFSSALVDYLTLTPLEALMKTLEI